MVWYSNINEIMGYKKDFFEIIEKSDSFVSNLKLTGTEDFLIVKEGSRVRIIAIYNEEKTIYMIQCKKDGTVHSPTTIMQQIQYVYKQIENNEE